MTDHVDLQQECARLRALLAAHQSEFLAEYRRQFPAWENAGQEALAEFERDALQHVPEEVSSERRP